MAPTFLLFLSVWSSLKKHSEKVFELASKTNIRIDFLHVYVSVVRIHSLRYVIQVTSDFPAGFLEVSICMHVMWFAFVDLPLLH